MTEQEFKELEIGDWIIYDFFDYYRGFGIIIKKYRAVLKILIIEKELIKFRSSHNKKFINSFHTYNNRVKTLISCLPEQQSEIQNEK
jgi:hypothetical protein